MPTEKEVDDAVDLYIELMEKGDPLWHEAEERAERLIQQRFMEEEG